MDIPNVDTLREQVQKHAEQRAKEIQERFRKRLTEAHQMMVKDLAQIIIDKVKKAMMKDFTYVNIWNPFAFDARYLGYRWTTIYYGFWDQKKFNRQIHQSHGITKTPIEEIIELMAPYGYEVADISDSNKSHSLVIRVKF